MGLKVIKCEVKTATNIIPQKQLKPMKGEKTAIEGKSGGIEWRKGELIGSGGKSYDTNSTQPLYKGSAKYILLWILKPAR